MDGPRLGAIGLLLALACVGCAEAGSRGTVERYDSAGVEVVVNPDPEALATNSLALSLEPLLEIGEEGRPDYEFFRIRAVRPAGDERILVVNAGTNELRYYSRDGEFLYATGGDGGGPGEFALLTSVHPYGSDSLAVADARSGRLSIFHESGDFGRAIRFQPPIPEVPEDVTLYVPRHVLGIFSDGSILCSLYDLIFMSRGPGWAVTERHLARWMPERDSVVGLGVFPVMDIFGEGGDAYPPPPLFSRGLRQVIHDDRIFVTTGRAFEIRVYDVQGGLIRRIREDRAPAPVTGADIARLRERRGEVRPERDATEERAVPETLPTFTELLVDDAGSVWVERYTFPDDDVRRWVAFDDAGVRTATVEVPRDFRLSSVKGDHLYGWTTDTLGVQRVRVYEVTR